MASPMVQVNVRLTPEQHSGLMRLVVRANTTLTDELRRAVDAHLAAANGRGKTK